MLTVYIMSSIEVNGLCYTAAFTTFRSLTCLPVDIQTFLVLLSTVQVVS